VGSGTLGGAETGPPESQMSQTRPQNPAAPERTGPVREARPRAGHLWTGAGER